jgi:diphthamide synthase (EF-2-diphthine--ammonia ligase)
LTEEGFRAVLTYCEEKWGNALWPGREIDNGFIDDVSLIADLDVCGERGEYHSFVFDGPIFSPSGSLEFRGDPSLKWFLANRSRSTGRFIALLGASSIQ